MAILNSVKNTLSWKLVFSVGLIISLLLVAWPTRSGVAAPTLAQVQSIQVNDTGMDTHIMFSFNQYPSDLQVEGLANPNTTTVSFSGVLASDKKANLLSYPGGGNVKQLYWEEIYSKATGAPRIQLFVHRLIPGSIHTKADPDNKRFHVFVKNQIPNFGSFITLEPGVKYSRHVSHRNQGAMLVNALMIDPRHPEVEIAPALPGLGQNSDHYEPNERSVITGLSSTRPISQKLGALAGINASFFKPDQKIPLGTLIVNGELLSGPIFDRAVFGITQDNEPVMDRLRLKGALLIGPDEQTAISIPIDNVNQPRVKLDQTVLYSTRWGSRAPAVPKNGYQLKIQKNRIVAVSNQQAFDIPKDGFIISGPANQLKDALTHVNKTDVRIRISTLPDWSHVKHAVGGGPYLLRNGNTFIDMAAEHFSLGNLRQYAPRTAIGRTPDGQILLVTANGLSNGEIGPSLAEMSAIMASLGAVDAMNLDGGGSTQMAVLGEEVHRVQGAGGWTRPVSTSLLVRKVTPNAQDARVAQQKLPTPKTPIATTVQH